jgi:membrane associated rhomboid family serine protease
MPILSILAGRSAAISLLIVNVLLSFSAFKRRNLYLKWILHPHSIIKRNEYYRLLTSCFVHNDAGHLVINGAMIALICGEFEHFLQTRSAFGMLNFLSIYLISHLIGTIAVILSNYRNYGYSSAGASGSILGCIMGFTILAPDYIAFYLPYFGGVKNQYASLFVIIGLIIYKWRSGNEFLDHQLHFFSALGGVAATLAFFPGII